MSVRDLWDKLMTNPRVKGFVAENENKLKGIVVMIVLVSVAAFMLTSHGNEGEEVSIEPVSYTHLRAHET